MHGKGPKKLGNYVPHELSAALHRGQGDIYRLHPIWSKVAGQDLSLHSRPVGYSSGCLSVQVDSPVWAATIRQNQQTLVHKLQQADGMEMLREIRIRVSPTAVSIGPVEQVHRSTAPISSNATESIHRTAEVVEDKELREALLRLEKTTSKKQNKT